MFQRRLARDQMILQFSADKYGPYSDRLRHMLNDLDGSYLHCDTRLSAKGAVSASCRFKTSPAPHSVLRVRLSDAGPSDTIWFDEERHPFLDVYLKQEDMRPLQRILDRTADRIDGYQSPLGMELLATVDWLLEREDCPATIEGIRQGLANWPAGPAAADRKQRLFDDRLIGLALHQLRSCN